MDIYIYLFTLPFVRISSTLTLSCPESVQHGYLGLRGVIGHGSESFLHLDYQSNGVI